jgi:hypothetical protein
MILIGSPEVPLQMPKKKKEDEIMKEFVYLVYQLLVVELQADLNKVPIEHLIDHYSNQHAFQQIPMSYCSNHCLEVHLNQS